MTRLKRTLRTRNIVGECTICQSMLDSARTIKTLFLHCTSKASRLHFFSRLFPLLAGGWPQTTMPSEKAYNF